MSNSTHADEFAKAHPGRYFEMFIAEQQTGRRRRRAVSVRGLRPVRRRPSPRSSPAPTTSSGWPPSRRRTSACAAPTPGCRDRRGRPVADGAGGPRDDARRAGSPRCCIPATPPAPPRWCGDGRREAASSTCARPAAPTRCCTTRRRPSRSAARRWSGPAPDDRVTLVGAGVTLHECLAAADQLGRTESPPASSTCTR